MTSEDFTPSWPYGVERQFQIYLERRLGKRPTLPVAFEALEQQAKAHLSPETWGFLTDGAGSQDTLRANLAYCTPYAARCRTARLKHETVWHESASASSAGPNRRAIHRAATGRGGRCACCRLSQHPVRPEHCFISVDRRGGPGGWQCDTLVSALLE